MNGKVILKSLRFYPFGAKLVQLEEKFDIPADLLSALTDTEYSLAYQEDPSSESVMSNTPEIGHKYETF